MVIILKCLESVFFFFLIVYFSKNLPKPKERNLTSFSNLKRISKDLRFLKNIFFRCLAVSQKGGLLSLPPFHESIGRAFPFCQTQSERTGVGRAPYLGELFLQLWVCILLVTMRKCSFLQKKKEEEEEEEEAVFCPPVSPTAPLPQNKIQFPYFWDIANLRYQVKRSM